MTFGSLFAGIGGLDLGLERAGMECLWQVEINDYATQVLERHWPGVRRHRDVRTFPPAGDWSVDLICGGFPCQDISYAGRGAGLEGERSGLFFEAIRVVRQLRPRYVLLENVAALLTRGLDRVHGELATLGYSSESHCIPAAAVGAPHIRDRVFVLAHAIGNGRRPRGSECAGQQRKVASISTSGKMADADEQGPQGRAGEELPERAGQCVIGAGGSLARLREQCTHWVTEPDVGRVAHGVPKRVDRLKCLGNAVVPQVAEFIGRELIRRIP